MNRVDFLARRLHAAWQRKGPGSALLLPLSWLVRGAIACKKWRYRKSNRTVVQSHRPVVVVGNIYVGGTGKTPVVIALVQALRDNGWQPGVISRGYGVRVGKQAKPGRGELDARQFGDEPALIARQTQAPVAVHPRRVLALHKLEQTYPDVDVVIADDGLQHLALERDIEIVVQDARGLGNGRVLPAGPLREPPNKLHQVDYVITNLDQGQPPPAPLSIAATQISLRLVPSHVVHCASGLRLDWAQWRAQHGAVSVSAVAGIGRPERFFSMLRGDGIRLENAIALPDHYPFSESPFSQLTSAQIFITSKDAVKCADIDDDRLWAVHVEPRFSDPDWIDGLIQKLHVIAQAKQP